MAQPMTQQLQQYSTETKRNTLLTITMASFLTPFVGSAINLAIPAIGAQYNASALHLSWVVTSYILASAAFLVPFGRMADMVGRKKVYLTGLLIFALCSLLCGLSSSVETLIAFRCLQGVGSAMMFSTAMAILTSVFAPQERGKILGINVATVYVGLSLGPVLGGALNHQLGWQSIFYLCVLISLIAVGVGVKKLPADTVGIQGEKYDFSGAMLYSVGLVAFLYSISSIAAQTSAIFILVAGLCILTLFVRHELNTAFPVLNFKLFKGNKTFAFSNLAALINYSATFALTFLLSLYLQVVLGYNSQNAGLILLVQPVLMALLSPFAGRLSDKVAPRIVSSGGMALCTLGLVMFVFLSANTPLWFIMINLVFLGIGFALFSSPNSNSVMGSVEKRFLGVASSILGTMRLAGQAISMAVATLIVTSFVGDVEFAQADIVLLTKSIKTAFMVFAITCFAGIFASLARGEVKAE